MKLKIFLPTEVLLEESVNKVVAEAGNGAFGLLPNHIDFVTALVPGILSFESTQGQEIFLAVDEGILVKCGSQVTVSTIKAIQGTDLETLHKTITEQFLTFDERQKKTRSAIAKLEASFFRGFLQIRGG